MLDGGVCRFGDRRSAGGCDAGGSRRYSLFVPDGATCFCNQGRMVHASLQ
jgi:hypothetical protein